MFWRTDKTIAAFSPQTNRKMPAKVASCPSLTMSRLVSIRKAKLKWFGLTAVMVACAIKMSLMLCSKRKRVAVRAPWLKGILSYQHLVIKTSRIECEPCWPIFASERQIDLGFWTCCSSWPGRGNSQISTHKKQFFQKVYTPQSRSKQI